MPIEHQNAQPIENATDRPIWQAMKKGMRLKCPSCGQGKLFRSYLKVNDACPHCGEELHHHRADDAPPYFTMFIVGHIIVAGILHVEQTYAPPTWVHGMIWVPLLIAMSLLLLPPIKGALVALQWAIRMHGFDKSQGADVEHSKQATGVVAGS